MPFNRYEGTQSATVPSDHTLATVDVAGNYLLYLDVSNMVLEDFLEVVINIEVLEADTVKLPVFRETYAHVQTDKVIASIPFTVATDTEANVVINQLEGTSRNFKWAIRDMGPDS